MGHGRRIRALKPATKTMVLLSQAVVARLREGRDPVFFDGRDHSTREALAQQGVPCPRSLLCVRISLCSPCAWHPAAALVQQARDALFLRGDYKYAQELALSY